MYVNFNEEVFKVIRKFAYSRGLDVSLAVEFMATMYMKEHGLLKEDD